MQKLNTLVLALLLCASMALAGVWQQDFERGKPDGWKWLLEDIKIGVQDPAMTYDQASAVADFSHGLGFVYWCQWKNPQIREQKDGIGQLRFCLVSNVATLLTNN